MHFCQKNTKRLIHEKTVILRSCAVQGCKRVSSYIAQYPVIRIAQSALHFTSLTDLLNQTSSWLLWEEASHMLQLIREGCSYTYPPLSIAMYSFIQLSELGQCRVKKLAQGFNTAAQDLNPGPLSRESEALPLSHCALVQLNSLVHRNSLLGVAGHIWSVKHNKTGKTLMVCIYLT